MIFTVLFSRRTQEIIEGTRTNKQRRATTGGVGGKEKGKGEEREQKETKEEKEMRKKEREK